MQFESFKLNIHNSNWVTVTGRAVCDSMFLSIEQNYIKEKCSISANDRDYQRNDSRSPDVIYECLSPLRIEKERERDICVCVCHKIK